MIDGVFYSDTKSVCLKRGTADYWLLYVQEGMVNVSINEQDFYVSDGKVAIIAFSARDILVVSRGNWKGFVLQLFATETLSLVRQYLAMMNATELPVCVITTGKQQENVKLLMERITSDEHEKTELLQELLVRLYRASIKMNPCTGINCVEITEDLCAYMDKEYAQPFRLDMLANRYNLSRSYLSHLFKNATGTSIMQYLLDCRINAACNYLKYTAMPIKTVAEKCGFNNVSNFGRTFKKEVGFSPRQYRLNNLQNEV